MAKKQFNKSQNRISSFKSSEKRSYKFPDLDSIRTYKYLKKQNFSFFCYSWLTLGTFKLYIF